MFFFCLIILILDCSLILLNQTEKGQRIKSLADLRAAYVNDVHNLKIMEKVLKMEKKSTCYIAEKISEKRRIIGYKYKNYTPIFFRDFIYYRNMKKYHDPLGPTFQYLEQSGKSCEQIIRSAKNPDGEDLGLGSVFFELVSDGYWVCGYIGQCQRIVLPQE